MVDFEPARVKVAQGARVLSKIGLLDPLGHVSQRVGRNAVAVTPGYEAGARPFPRLRPEDVVVVDLDGAPISSGHAPTSELSLHLAMYRARPDVGAVVMACPPYATALAISGFHPLPITHAEAWLAIEATPIVEPVGLLSNRARADEFVAAIGENGVCHLRGMGIVFVAGDVAQAMSLCHAYEYLARMNVLTADLSRKPRLVSQSEVAAIQADRRSEETVKRVRPSDYLASFDDPGMIFGPTIDERLDAPPGDEVGTIKAKIAVSCRLLAARETLVGFYEHVSHRLPDGERFAMCPAKNFAHMAPEDIAIIGLDADSSWLDGPYAPAPFRRYHRDLLAMRSDVRAIVHTHEMYGRAFTMADRTLEPVFRNGLDLARRIPTVERCCMVFSPRDREEALLTLGEDNAVHVLAHGTDYLANSIEKATMDAIHREQAFHIYHIALRFGEPRPLPAGVQDEIRRLGPSPRVWWEFYAAFL